ncbi:MAG: serine hydroxymethyltransferase [Hyphomicrobiales bacterium]
MNDYEEQATGGRIVYFEFVPLGRQVKVIAVDGRTGDEVSIVGPMSTPRGDLERLAVRKLDALLARRGEAPKPAAPQEPGGRGKLV